MELFPDEQVQYFFFSPLFNKLYLKFAIVADLKQKHNSAEERMISEMFSADEGKRLIFKFRYDMFLKKLACWSSVLNPKLRFSSPPDCCMTFYD